MTDTLTFRIFDGDKFIVRSVVMTQRGMYKFVHSKRLVSTKQYVRWCVVVGAQAQEKSVCK